MSIASKAGSSARVNGSGRTRFTITDPNGTSSSARARCTSPMVSLTGISSGVVTTCSAVVAGSESSSTIHSVCWRTGPTCTSPWMARGESSWETMWPVAAASTTTRSQSARPSREFAHLPAQLADGEDLADAGRRGGDEVEDAGQRSEPPEHRDPPVQPQVLAQRILGAHLHREDARVDLTRFEPDRGLFEQRGEVAFGVDLDEQHAAAPLGREQRDRRGDRALADPALAGEEEELAVQEARAERRRGHRVSRARSRPVWWPRRGRSRRTRAARRAPRRAGRAGR